VQRRKDGDDDRRRRGRVPTEEDDAGVAGPSGWWESLWEVPAKGMGRSARLGEHRGPAIARRRLTGGNGLSSNPASSRARGRLGRAVAAGRDTRERTWARKRGEGALACGSLATDPVPSAVRCDSASPRCGQASRRGKKARGLASGATRAREREARGAARRPSVSGRTTGPARGENRGGAR
jgi:hypothetical protein